MAVLEPHSGIQADDLPRQISPDEVAQANLYGAQAYPQALVDQTPNLAEAIPVNRLNPPLAAPSQLPDFPGLKKQRNIFWSSLIDLVKDYPIREATNLFVLSLTVLKPSKDHTPYTPSKIVIPESVESAYIALFDSAKGIWRSRLIPKSESLPTLGADMALEAGIVVVCQPVPPLFTRYRSTFPATPLTHLEFTAGRYNDKVITPDQAFVERLFATRYPTVEEQQREIERKAGIGNMPLKEIDVGEEAVILASEEAEALEQIFPRHDAAVTAIPPLSQPQRSHATVVPEETPAQRPADMRSATAGARSILIAPHAGIHFVTPGAEPAFNRNVAVLSPVSQAIRIPVSEMPAISQSLVSYPLLQNIPPQAMAQTPSIGIGVTPSSLLYPIVYAENPVVTLGTYATDGFITPQEPAATFLQADTGILEPLPAPGTAITPAIEAIPTETEEAEPTAAISTPSPIPMIETRPLVERTTVERTTPATQEPEKIASAPGTAEGGEGTRFMRSEPAMAPLTVAAPSLQLAGGEYREIELPAAETGTLEAEVIRSAAEHAVLEAVLDNPVFQPIIDAHTLSTVHPYHYFGDNTPPAHQYDALKHAVIPSRKPTNAPEPPKPAARHFHVQHAQASAENRSRTGPAHLAYLYRLFPRYTLGDTLFQ